MTVGRREGKSIRATAGEIGRGPSTVKREPGRNSPGGGRRRASAARRRGDARRLRRRRRGRLGDPAPALARAGEGPPGQRSPGRVPAGWRSGAAGGPSPAPPQGAPSPAAGRAPPSRGAPARGPAGRLRHPRQAPPPRRGGAKGQVPHPPRDPRAARPHRDARQGEGVRGLGPGGEGGGGGVLLLRRPPPPGEGGRREHQRAHPRAPPQGHRLLPRHRRGGRGGVRWDQPQAGASAWAGGLPRKPTTQRRCTCSENSGPKKPATISKSEATNRESSRLCPHRLGINKNQASTQDKGYDAQTARTRHKIIDAQRRPKAHRPRRK